MRATLKKLLFISLFFSTTASSAMQANLLKVAAGIGVVAVGGALVWKVLKEEVRKKNGIILVCGSSSYHRLQS